MTTPSRTVSRLARTTLAALAVAAAATLTGTATDRAAAEEPTPTRVDPDRLERGADSSAAYVKGRTIVEDGVVTRVRRDWVQLLGTRPDGHYVVLVPDDRGEQVRTYRPGGGGRKLLGDTYGAFEVVLGSDGTTLVMAGFKQHPRRHTLLRAYDSTSGERLGQRKRQGALTPLDGSTSTVVYSGENGPARSWELDSGATTRVSSDYAYQADLSLDRLAVFTKDPYRGGCTVVSTLSDPGTRLWRSCSEAVRAWSSDGSHLLTTHLLADGLGPNQVRVRTVEGAQTGWYDVDGVFGQLLFEDEDTALLETWTTESSGLARCDGPDCELASDLGKAPSWL